MLIAVFSDTHGSCGGMLAAARRVRPDVLVHLGDHLRDARCLRSEFPDIPLYAVPGNCDYNSREPDSVTFLAGPVTVFAAHGHRYGVKVSLDSLLCSAHCAGASLVLFGHTHTPLVREVGGIKIMNPGSAGTGLKPTFGVVEIGEGGGFVCRIMDI